MPTTRKKNIRKPSKKRSLETMDVVIVRHEKVPTRETEKMKRLNKLLENAIMMD